MSVVVLIQGNLRPGGKEALMEYYLPALAVVAKHGGEAVALGSAGTSLYGASRYEIGIVLKFPDKAAVDGWYNDPDYRKLIPLRERAYSDLEISLFQLR